MALRRFAQIEDDRLSKNDEKLPYLHKISESKFLVIDKNMELCLFVYNLKIDRLQ